MAQSWLSREETFGSRCLLAARKRGLASLILLLSDGVAPRGCPYRLCAQSPGRDGPPVRHGPLKAWGIS